MMDGEDDEQWLFQPELIVEAADGSPVFTKRRPFHDPRRTDPLTMAEERMMPMLYRHQIEFAVGHNVAVHAEPAADNAERAIRVRTQTVPTYEVPMQTPPTKQEVPGLAGVALDMKALAEAAATDLPDLLKALPDA